MRQIIVGVFDKYDSAQRAAQVLESNGLSADHVHITSANYDDSGIVKQTSSSQARDQDDEGVLAHVRHFFSDLFGSDDDSRDMVHYAEAVRRGGAVVKVDVDEESEASQVRDLLESAGAVDIDQQIESWRAQGWQEPEALSARQSAGAYGQSSGGQQNTALRSDARQASQEEDVLPVVQENLEVGKRVVSRGGVRVYSRTIERPVEEQIQLREEIADVQRRAVDRPATEADLASLRDRTVEVRETEERPVVQKTARVVEEVAVGKRVQERTERVQDTVRSTEVNVERLDSSEQLREQDTRSDYVSDDDSPFRSHFASSYQSSGDRYEDYAPAYSYGRQLRSDARYQGREWDDIENDVRTDWESRNPGSSWERFKAAVQHAWKGMITS